MRLARLLPIALAWATLGCDGLFGRWDRVRVEVGDPGAAEAQPTAGTESGGEGATDGGSTGGTTGGTTGEPAAPADTTSPVVDAGADVLTNATFSRTGTATDAAAMTYLWEKTSGPGTVTFSASTALTTDVAASISGVYTIRLTATDASGNKSADSFSLNWDAAGPAAPATGTLKLAADSAGAAAATVDDDASVFLVWGAADDGEGSGVKNYTVQIFNQSACAGTPAEVTAVAGTDQVATGLDGETISFRVKAIDNLDQAGPYSDCKSGIKVDLTDPVVLGGFTVDEGATLATATVGTNRVTVDFPNGAPDIADYDRVVVRRLKGGVPAAACNDGQIAKAYSAPFTDPDVFFDFTNEAGESFGYRVCITDAAGRLKSTDTAAMKVSKPHVLFATAQGYTGDLSGAPAGGPSPTGLGRADFICDTTASTSATPEVQNEPNWKAVMSDTTTSARNRLSIVGVVKNPGLTAVMADDYSGFWSDPLQTFVDTDTGGIPQAFALTGTRANGLRGNNASQNCADFSSAAGTGWVGDTNGGATWLVLNEASNVPCSDGPNHYSLYCISQPADAPAIPTMALEPSTGSGLTITIRQPSDLSRYSHIDLFRQGGATAPSAECDSGFIDTLTPTTAGTDLVYEDASATSGNPFSYRACVFDAYGNIITTKTALNVIAN